MDDLNDEVGSDKTLLRHGMRGRALGDHDDNGERFLDFCSFHRLVFGIGVERDLMVAYHG